MSLNLNLPTLRSRTTQAAIDAKRQAGKALSNIIPKLKQFAGWLFTNIVNYFHLSFTSLWDVFVNAYFAIKYFNFNATDEELNKQMERNNEFILNIAGNALGTYLGFQAVRLASLWIGKFTGDKSASVASNIKIPVLSAEIGIALAHEANSLLANQFRFFLAQSAAAQVSNFLISALLTARKNHFLGLSEVTKPITDGSIATKIDKVINQLPDFLHQPLEQAIQGFEMGVIQAGYVVAYKIDDHIAAAKYAHHNAGVQRKVEVVVEPDSDEKLEIQGTQNDVQTILNETTLGTLPLIVNRDVGTIAAEIIDEQVKLQTQLRKLVITFNEHPKPPYRIKGVLGVRAEISIPDAKAGLEWEEVKEIVPSYERGQWFCSVELSNGRSMQGWFASPTVGEEILEQLSTLSTAKIRLETFRSSKGVTGGVIPADKLMHPQFASMLFPLRREGERIGQKGKPQKVNLWPNSKPSGFTAFH